MDDQWREGKRSNVARVTSDPAIDSHCNKRVNRSVISSSSLSVHLLMSHQTSGEEMLSRETYPLLITRTEWKEGNVQSPVWERPSFISLSLCTGRASSHRLSIVFAWYSNTAVDLLLPLISHCIAMCVCVCSIIQVNVKWNQLCVNLNVKVKVCKKKSVRWGLTCVRVFNVNMVKVEWV